MTSEALSVSPPSEGAGERPSATGGPGPARALADAEVLVEQRRHIEAIAVLTSQNRIARNRTVETRLARLRYEAFATLDRTPNGPWPPAVPAGIELCGRPPEIPATELTSDLVAAGILGHGSLIVRGFTPEWRVAQLREHVDAAFEARERHLEGVPVQDLGGTYVPIKVDKSFQLPGRRKLNRDGGALWVADSPPALFDVVEMFQAARLGEVLEGYLGERPALTLNKFTLRRVSPKALPSWHQDGAFMGTGLRTVNVWLALGHCGGDLPTPGLDIVARRLPGLFATGTEDAYVENGVAHALVQREAGDDIVRPTFAPGDALLFDDIMLHRTATEPGMTDPRYAVESWFFAPSSFPTEYVPLVF